MKIRVKWLMQLTAIYLFLPVVVFFIGFLQPWWAALFTLLGIGGMFFFFKETNKRKDYLTISWPMLIVVVLVVFAWIIIAGNMGSIYQTYDYNWRNATFRDIVNSKWPVMYHQNTAALVYYIGCWMVPSLFGKLFGWGAANVALGTWNAIGILLFVLLSLAFLKFKGYKKILMLLAFVIFFGGMDALKSMWLTPNVHDHLEWWAYYFQYSSNTTQLFFVFNQAIAAWICTALFLLQKNIRSYVFIIVLALPYSPLPAVGLAVLMAFKGVAELINYIKGKNVLQFVKDAFSPQNILMFFSIIFVYYFYYTSNASLNAGASSLIDLSVIKAGDWAVLVEFYLAEFLVLAIVLFKQNIKNPVYYASVVSLFTFLFVQVGLQHDFSMRGTIPALIVLMLLSAQYVGKFNKRQLIVPICFGLLLFASIFVVNFYAQGANTIVVATIVGLLAILLLGKLFVFNKNLNTKIACILMVACLFVGAYTPFIEFYRNINGFVSNKCVSVIADEIGSFEYKDISQLTNFLAANPNETIFFKYLAKK